MASPESIIVLPTEILENIFAIFTDFLDLKSLRETCRTFEPLAAARLFETVTVLFSLRSLYFLRKIASHPVAQHVRRLEFQGGRLDYFRDRFQWESEIERRRHLAEKTPYSQGIDPYNKYDEKELAAGWKAYRSLYIEQKVTCGPPPAMIGLTNCRKLSVRVEARTKSLTRFSLLRTSNRSPLKKAPP